MDIILTYGILYIIISGYIFDIILGDPYWLPHPVRYIGRLITWCEKKLRTYLHNLKYAGVLLLIITVTIVLIITLSLLWVAKYISIYLEICISIVLTYFALSIRCLADEANGVYCALKENNLTLAKKRLSMLVSRDTANMDRQQIIRGTIETVAENTVDGILSPMFYLFIGGLPGVWIYKTVNTLDAMVGYKDEAYKELGWASAKIDDILNYIPARISGWIIIPIAGLLCCLNMKQAILTVLCDASKHPSPNSGYPEAAFAGALNIQLGGISYYHGKPQMKPVIGKSYQEVEMEHIKLAIWLMYTTSGLGLIIGCACWIILKIVTQGL